MTAEDKLLAFFLSNHYFCREYLCCENLPQQILRRGEQPQIASSSMHIELTDCGSFSFHF